MLYKLTFNDKNQDNLEPVQFYDLSELSKIEKDLENLLAENLLDKLFEDNALMPIYQERPLQSIADIYALTSNGDLVLFELKRGIVGDDAMVQILRYAQFAGQWSYDKLNIYYKKNYPEKELATAHKESFELDRELTPAEFNRDQLLYVVGSAANEVLAKSLSYWKAKGLKVEFIPYRIYQIADQLYFEFFSKPHDIHKNPKQIKGIILDTNRTYEENGIWHMLEKGRASIWRDAQDYIYRINKNDYILLSHKYCGIVAAGQVISKQKYDEDEEEKYVNVKWITKVPNKEEGLKKYIPFSKVTELLDHGFYWATTLKTPYLNIEETKLLIDELNKMIE